MRSHPFVTSDRIGGAVWILFGAAIVYGSWMMDRLESLQAPPLTAPGLVPGLLGLGLVAFGAILVMRSAPTGAVAEVASSKAAQAVHVDDFEWRRVSVSWLLCITYAAVLLGRGIPYWVLTATFLILHMLLIDEDRAILARPSNARLLMVAIVAVAVTIAVSQIFQNVFLVRLP
jgi:hypothetical protein